MIRTLLIDIVKIYRREETSIDPDTGEKIYNESFVKELMGRFTEEKNIAGKDYGYDFEVAGKLITKEEVQEEDVIEISGKRFLAKRVFPKKDGRKIHHYEILLGRS